MSNKNCQNSCGRLRTKKSDLCSECSRKHRKKYLRDYHIKYFAEKKMKKKCFTCGKKVDIKSEERIDEKQKKFNVRCSECKEKQRKYYKKYYDEHKEHLRFIKGRRCGNRTSYGEWV